MMIGTLYDGTRKRLKGNGPSTFTTALDAKLKFKTMLYNKSNGGEDKNKLRSDDRLWALPDNFDLSEAGSTKILVDMANVIKRGNRVGLASSSEHVLNLVRDSIISTLQQSSGSA